MVPGKEEGFHLIHASFTVILNACGAYRGSYGESLEEIGNAKAGTGGFLELFHAILQ